MFQQLKRIAIACFLLAIPLVSQSQNFNYNLTKDSIVYVPLSGATILTAGEDFTNQNFSIHFPFQFNFCGSVTDSVKIEGNGFVVFDNAKGLAAVSFNNFGSKKDTNQNYVSSISYAVSGSQGNRILKIEFKNLAQSALSNYDFLNYQVWLYENSNKVEYHIGNNSYANEMGEGIPALIGIINRNMDTENKAYLVKGIPSTPEGQLISGESEFVYINNVPFSGTVYTITPTFN